MRRPASFKDIKGHDWLLDYLNVHLRNKTLPQFIILEGPEGLGKTSLADLIALNLVYGIEDSEEKRNAVETIINNNGSNDYIKRYKCSVEGGKEVAKEILAEMTNNFMLNNNKVLICDECHNFVDAAQDVFLAETEFMKKGMYLLMLTTDVQKLKASLRSRAVNLHLYPLKQSDMMEVLSREVSDRNLRIQNEQATLQLICEWSECKPRTGLSMLKAFADGDAVSSKAIQEMIGVVDVMDVLPVLESLASSMTFGLNYILSMKVSNSIVSIVAECYKLKSGSPSYKIPLDKVKEIKTRLKSVTCEQIAVFLHGITRYQTLNQNCLINSFITAHLSCDILKQKDTSHVLVQELSQKNEAGSSLQVNGSVTNIKVPTLDELIANADVIRGGN